MIEIERKFLIKSLNFKNLAVQINEISQGYLNSHSDRTVRIRLKNDKGYITIKGKSNDSGTSRFEWEKEIPITEAQQLLRLCESGIIDKIRYRVKLGNHTYEIDEFQGAYKGLTIIEIELSTPDEVFEKPEWLGKEVTGDKRFYNSYLSNPENIGIIREIISC